MSEPQSRTSVVLSPEVQARCRGGLSYSQEEACLKSKTYAVPTTRKAIVQLLATTAKSKLAPSD